MPIVVLLTLLLLSFCYRTFCAIMAFSEGRKRPAADVLVLLDDCIDGSILVVFSAVACTGLMASLGVTDAISRALMALYILCLCGGLTVMAVAKLIKNTVGHANRPRRTTTILPH